MIFLKLKVENGKLKIAVGQTVCKMQNNVFPTVFIYMKLPSHYFAAQFQFNILNGAQMQVLTGIQLPKCKFRPAVYNRLGVAWAASGNTLKYRSYSDLGT